MAQDLDPLKLSSPRIFLIRMVVFLILCSLIVVVLYKQMLVAFMANPGLNALIIGVLLIGIALAFRQVVRLFPEVNWVNSFRLADPGLAVERPPVLLAPMASILGDRIGRMTISSQTIRAILDPTPGPPGGAPSKDLRPAMDQRKETIIARGANRAATAGMANLAEAIQGLVHHMRPEQQMIRDWVDSQAEQHREIRRLLEILVRENVNKELAKKAEVESKCSPTRPPQRRHDITARIRARPG